MRGCALIASAMSSQRKVPNTAFTSARSASGSGYGRPPAIARANALDSQHASTSRSAASAEAALNSASVEACGPGLTMRSIQSAGPARVIAAGGINHR
jgi:hypothetical protein